jgi:hypothetical protein
MGDQEAVPDVLMIPDHNATRTVTNTPPFMRGFAPPPTTVTLRASRCMLEHVACAAPLCAVAMPTAWAGPRNGQRIEPAKELPWRNNGQEFCGPNKSRLSWDEAVRRPDGVFLLSFSVSTAKAALMTASVGKLIWTRNLLIASTVSRRMSMESRSRDAR